MTIGPWRPVTLHTYQNRISDVDVRSQVSESLAVKLIADLAFSEQVPGLASFVLKNANGSIEASANRITIENGHCKVTFDWAPGKLDLWYPVGYGAQPMYMVEVELTDEVRLYGLYFSGL
jgi:beta-mannosidase